jgi:TonB family protein
VIASLLLGAALALAADAGVGDAPARPDATAEASASDGGRPAVDQAGPPPLTTPPLPLTPASPSYPAAARAAGRQGTVVIRLHIDKDGQVTDARVTAGVHPDLDDVALEAARAMTFRPARRDGQPIAAVIDWRVEFRLPELAAPAPVGAPPPAVRAPASDRRGTLVGRALEKGTRRALAGVAITLGVEPAGEADARGRFSVEAPCGPQHLTFQQPGFDPLTVTADPCAAAPPLEVRLPRRTGAPSYETVVRAPSSHFSTHLEKEELTTTPGSMGDPLRVIESLPGVTSALWPAAIYAIRGANPGNTGFFLDDLRIPALFHFALGPSVIHPYFFRDMDFYPGGYPARFGRYVGGVVSAHTRAPPTDAVHGSADVRLYDAGGLVSAPFPDGQGAVAVAARYSYTGAVISLLSDTVRLDYWDYQARVDRTVGRARLTLLAFGSRDVLLSSSVDTPNREVALRFHRLALRAELPAGGGLLLGSVGLGSDHSKAPLADQFPIVVDARSVSPRLAYRRPTRHVDLEVGFDGELTRYSPLASVVRPGSVDLVRERDVRLLAGYLSATVRAGSRLLLTPEVRLDSYTVTGTERRDLAPRLSGRLTVTGGTVIHAASGRFTQTPSIPLQVPGVESFGLALYGLQSSWQGSLGAGTTRLFPGVTLDVTGYIQRYVLTDLRDPRIEAIDPLQDDFLVPRDALSYGVELMVRRPATERLHGWLAYTLSTSQRALGGGVIAPSDWDQRHVVNLVLGYRWGRTTVGGRAHVHTGRPVLVVDSQGPELQRLPPFYQLDLRVDRRMIFDRYALTLYAELVNATLTRQVVSLTDTGTGQRQGDFRIVIPSIGVHGEF